MRLPGTGRTIVRCPNQHEFEIDVLAPEQLAIQRFVCELCGARFSVDIPPPPLSKQPPTEGSQPSWKNTLPECE